MFIFFFFKQKTAYEMRISDWSSDVCSSDLIEGGLEKAGVAVLHGETRFTGRDTVAVNGETFSARHFHIATGARPMTLNIPGEELLTTSTDFLELPERPDRAVFVGGGFIAMEIGRAHV